MTRAIHVLELRSVRGTGGGPEKTILLGAARPHRLNIQVTVCYIRDGRDTVFRVEERAASLGVTYAEVHERHSLDFRIWPQLRRIVRERQIDIVHTHEYKTNLLGLLLSRATGVVPLATAHGWTGQSLRERYLYYPVDKRLLSRFPHVIAVSSDIKQELMHYGTSRDRITVLLNAIDPVAFRRIEGLRDPVRREIGYGSNHFVIGTVGRLERQKRFDLLLEAFASLRLRRPNLRLAIVGDGSLRSDLAQLAARLQLGESCTLLGHREDIPRLHHAFDVFVQCSEYEGTPNAVLEAMAMETPLIATDVGGTRELAESDACAIIIPKHDVSALRGAIEAVLIDPVAAHRRAAAARRRVESQLSFDARTRRLEGIYESLVRERHDSRTRGEVVARVRDA